MAQKKQPYSWARVKPGNIISFKYKSKSSGKNYIQTIERHYMQHQLLISHWDGDTNTQMIL